MTPADARVRLAEFFAKEGEPVYRAGQVLDRLWKQPADFGGMTNLPKRLRDRLETCVRGRCEGGDTFSRGGSR